MGFFDLFKRKRKFTVEDLKELESVMINKEQRKHNSDDFFTQYQKFQNLQADIARREQEREEEIRAKLEEASNFDDDEEDEHDTFKSEVERKFADLILRKVDQPQQKTLDGAFDVDLHTQDPHLVSGHQVNPAATSLSQQQSTAAGTLPDEMIDVIVDNIKSKVPKKFQPEIKKLMNLSDADLIKIKKKLVMPNAKQN